MFGDFFNHDGEDGKDKNDPSSYNRQNGDGSQENQSSGSSSGSGSGSGTDDPYGGNVQYKWNYDDYQRALEREKSASDSGKNEPPYGDFQAVDPSKLPQKKKRSRGLRVFIISLCSVFGVAVLVLAGFSVASMIKNGGVGGLTSSTSSTSGGITLTDKPSSSSSTVSTASTSTGIQLSAAQVVSKVKQSVVTVETYDMKSVDPSAEGSGIIASSDGYIITNAHVISGGTKFEVLVTQSNGTTKSYDATVKGSDTRSDLAVLKINATGLSAATFGNSSQIQVGESVLAIGNPGGEEFAGSVTSGIISATNRSITTNGYTQTVLQTDAAINPGNSGGALVNMYGQVIGITSSKIEETGYEGMGFAIPINSAQPIVDSIIKNGYVTGRVKLGISVEAFTSYQAKLYNMPTGLLVASVDSSSDAASKGIKQNDVITKINGQSITSGDSSTWYDNFYNIESKYKAGDTVTLTVARYNSGSAYQTLTFKVKLAEDKGDTSSTSSDTESESGNYSYSYGNNDNSNGNSSDNGGFSFFGNSN